MIGADKTVRKTAQVIVGANELKTLKISLDDGIGSRE